MTEETERRFAPISFGSISQSSDQATPELEKENVIDS